ncbi:serine/threonine-protein kinase TBK1-like [Ruditapes philippinarum]|uniref:serine/threonine-protein kinase TBK1-like n=1 Tax=Ruditapes philippinarum TaxID=129788 RepID=UPI00295AFAE4|nr:serine/threonine-protein kinase TBK1-like [Ruditapes philippinarum]
MEYSGLFMMPYYNSPGPAGGSGADKAGPLRYTHNYVYNIADLLGKGATASVYLGRERKNGQQVAIKVFSNVDSRQITQARLRETELLKSVDHRNVMQLFACESEIGSGQYVIVMPYCQCGSVYNLLEQPQNGFGFQEKEFLTFLKDITSGLKYLNQKGVIHRDIKPGNIMKKVDEDGSPVYILTDFGAAKELGEDETFMSIYGTEEYIHPDMFQRAVLRQPGQQHFTSSVDLWSMAVTIYHVATGKLPFQAFGGRNDSRMMFEIMAGRRSGDVSGIQRDQNGPIDRSQNLPDNCYISRGLRKLIEPILAALFEINTARAMTFDQYFIAVNDVIQMKTLKMFCAQTGTQTILYLHKTDCYTHIQEKIASLTEIPADRQLLLGHTELKEIVESHEQIQTFPKSVQNAQLFLFERDNYEWPRIIISSLPPFPSFTVNSSLSSDSAVAKKCAAIAYFIEWKTKESQSLQNFLLESKLYLRLYVQHKLCPIDKVVPELDKALGLTRKRIDCLQISQTNVVLEMMHSENGIFKQLKTHVETFCDGGGYISDLVNKTNTRCEEIKLYLSVLGQRMKEGSTPTDHMGCHDDDYCLPRIEHIRQGIQTVSSTFSKHKKCGELLPHEKFIHQVERQKLEDLCVKIVSLFQSHCLENLKRVHVAVNKHLSVLLKHLTRTGKVETNIKCVVDCETQVNEKLDKIDECYGTVSELLKSNIKTIVDSPDLVRKKAKLDQSESTEITDISEPSSGSATEKGEKALPMRRFLSEVTKYETEKYELDSLMDSNTQSLLELKKTLQETNRLSLTSFQSDKRSVECTKPTDSNAASGFF